MSDTKKEDLIKSISALLKGKTISEVKDLLNDVRKHIELKTVV